MQTTNHKFAYDGTFEGFLCLAVRCINMRSMPSRVTLDYVIYGAYDEGEYQMIRTNQDIATRFYNYIGQCSCPEVQQMILDCFLTSIPNKERDMIFLICRALRFGASVAEDYSNDTLNKIQMAICDLYREAQTSLDGIIFSRQDEVDVSLVNPRNSIIPLVKRSVLKKTDINDFIIYDKRHKLSLVRHGDLDTVMDVSRIPLPVNEITSQVVREYMWKYIVDCGLYGTAGIPQSRKANSLAPMWYIAV